MSDSASSEAPVPDTGSGRVSQPETRAGVFAALGAFSFWGLIPLYWKYLSFVNPLEIVCHRGIWSFVCILPVAVLSRRMPEVRAALHGRNILLLSLSTALLAANWLIFIWAVGNGKMLESSLGNFINPLFNMLCGVVFFRDRVSRLQWAAVALVAFAIAMRVVSLGYFPWVALSLCTTFSLYGMIRKIVSVESVPGLVVENMLFTPFAIAILVWLSGSVRLSFGTSAGTTALLLGAGLVTTLPMFLFAYAARHLNLTTLGIFHYIVPTLQFMLGVFVFKEPFSAMNFLSFAIIWVALAVYSYEKLRQRRMPGT